MSYLRDDRIKNNFDYEFHIIILGNKYAGKSCIVQRYIHDSFSEEHLLVLGVDMENKLVDINNKIVKLKIFDKPNTSNRFSPLPDRWYKGKDGAIIVYHLSDFWYYEDAFNVVKKTIEEIKSKADYDTEIIIFQNKCDKDYLEKDFETEEKVKKLANEFGIKHFVVSAKTGYNINEGFNSLVNDMITYFENHIRNNIEIKNSDDKNKKDKKKCA